MSPGTIPDAEKPRYTGTISGDAAQAIVSHRHEHIRIFSDCVDGRDWHPGLGLGRSNQLWKIFAKMPTCTQENRHDDNTRSPTLYQRAARRSQIRLHHIEKRQ